MSRSGATQPRTAIVIDIGGTCLKGGLITADGELLALQNLPSPARATPEQVVLQMLQMIDNLCDEAGISKAHLAGLGVSLAGFMNAAGLVTATAHLSREWVGYHLGERLAQEWTLPAYYSLDTPAPTLGEAYFGAGKGYADFVYVTVSTGIGAGIIAGGRYYIGGLGWAGGVGHIIIDENSPFVCEGCGNHGCLETFVAKQGILATATELMDRNPHSLLHTLLAGDRSALSPALICEAAQAGDATAVEVFRRAGHALGIGLTNLVDIVSPGRVVVGGGIAQAGDLLLEPARAVVRQRAFPPNHRQVEIVQAALGDLSGIYGAAAMVFHDLRINPE